MSGITEIPFFYLRRFPKSSRTGLIFFEDRRGHSGLRGGPRIKIDILENNFVIVNL